MRRQEEHNARGDNAADALGDPVAYGLFPADAPRHQHAQSHSRINMAAGDWPDGVGHRQQGKAKCHGNSHIADFPARNYSRSESGKDQDKGSKQLRGVFHATSPLMFSYSALETYAP